MKLQLEFKPEICSRKLIIGDKITLLGSCFSDEMAEQFKKSGFQVESNHLGTIFHPIALANLFLIDDLNLSIIQRDDLFLSWMAAGSIYGLNKGSYLKTLVDLRNELIDSIKKSSFLFVTFGTAYGYEHKEFTTVVANCHKFPSSEFDKILSSTGEMEQSWEMALEKIYEINPEIQVIFTVSPVRHSKDGLVENNRSKARLIEVTNRLTITEKEWYFPSYELVVDVLRDYRFYKEDFVHPTQQTVEYVYHFVEQVFMDSDTREITRQVRKLRELTSHKLLYPESIKSSEFELNTKNKIAKFLAEYPLVNW
jgi:hypothetical protein